MSTTGKRRFIFFIGISFLVAALLGIDRLVYLRRLMWSASAIKDIGAVYHSCEKPVEFLAPMNGLSLMEKCNSKIDHEQFRQSARQITVFPGGCANTSVIAWGPELHYWAESWMPLAPKAKRAVLFDDGHSQCVTLEQFAAFGCP